MKKYILILLVFAGSLAANAQTDYSTISMKTDADYKAADKYALEASNYLLSVPLDVKNPQQAKAASFILKWIEGTPDYTFIIDSPAVAKLFAENEGLMTTYLAGMTKFALDNPDKASDPQLVMVNGVKTLISYSMKPENKIAISPTLKKLVYANEQGELEKELK